MCHDRAWVDLASARITGRNHRRIASWVMTRLEAPTLAERETHESDQDYAGKKPE